MKTLVLAVLIAVAAVPSFAQAPDFSITIAADDGNRNPVSRAAVGEHVFYVVQWKVTVPVDPADAIVEIDLPGVATPVNPGVGMSCTTGSSVRCTISLVSGLHGFVQLEMPVGRTGTLTTTARVVHQNGKSDPNPANDTATHTFEAFATPSLHLEAAHPQQRVEPGSQGTISASVRNTAAAPATNVVLTMSMPAGGTILSGQSRAGNAACGVANNILVCTLPVLAQNQYLFVDMTFTAPARMTGEDLVFQMGVTAAEPDLDASDNQFTRTATMIRQFVVANVNDEGSGSLRQAIHDVNALCPTPKPCAILFRIPEPVPASGWFTIQPRTPLPMVAGMLKIDGRTQTSFTGDMNPDGPEIEINGAWVSEESGLRLQPQCEMEVRNLAVNGFPGYGIEVGRITLAPLACYGQAGYIGAILRENYLGTDPRGRMAKPNQRGLGLFSPEAFVYANVISGNRRAGIFAEDGFYYDIGGNRIGVGADGSPLGNGAGIFLNMRDDFPAGADIRQNVIAYNDGMAVARTRRGNIQVMQNSIFDNLQQGIDIDVDGASPQRANSQDVPNAPVLFSASYDPARNETVVRGRIDSDLYGQEHHVEVFASSRLSVWGMPQAEQSVQTTPIGGSHADLSLVLPGDLRGKWISVTYTVSRYLGLVRTPGGIGTETHRELHPGDTSELSNAVMVQ